jgi:hypothetical protein
MGNILDLQDMRVPRALHLPVCHRLQVALLEPLDLVWVQLVNQVPQILTQQRPLGRHKDSGLQVIQALIIRITGVVSVSSLEFISSNLTNVIMVTQGIMDNNPPASRQWMVSTRALSKMYEKSLQIPL